jgi:DNA-binding PadR family transcriptional regulator
MSPRVAPDPREFLPVKPVAFQVLLSLVDGERHGYAITQDIASRTSARAWQPVPVP